MGVGEVGEGQGKSSCLQPVGSHEESLAKISFEIQPVTDCVQILVKELYGNSKSAIEKGKF